MADAALAEAYRRCRREIAAHSKSFNLASALFPAERRDEVAALYAWCRACDDAIDLAPPSTHREKVKTLETNLRAVYGGAPLEDPILLCFREVTRRRGIPVQYPQDLLAGLAMDVDDASYETLDDLLVYCWRVAGTVGLMMCHVMGMSDGRAILHAAHLGIAMQLTNICRDVVEDWQRGRLYVPSALLPAETEAWLVAHRGQQPCAPLPPAVADALSGATRQLLGIAERYYASADVGLGYLEPRSALAVRTARLVYAEIGRCIEARGCDVTRGRAFVPLARKLRLTARALRGSVADRRRWQAPELIAPQEVLHCAEAVRLA